MVIPWYITVIVMMLGKIAYILIILSMRIKVCYEKKVVYFYKKLRLSVAFNIMFPYNMVIFTDNQNSACIHQLTIVVHEHISQLFKLQVTFAVLKRLLTFRSTVKHS